MPRKARSVPWIEIRNGIFYASWYEPDARRTRRESLQTDDAVLATQRFADWLNRRGGRLESTGEITCGKLLDQYLEEHSKVRCVDHHRNEMAVERLKRHFGVLKPLDIDVPACRAYGDLRRGDGVTDQTIRRELATLVAALNHGVKWKRITRTQVPVVELPSKATAKEVGYFTKPELAKIRQAARELAAQGGAHARLPAFVDLCYFTASRRDAIEKLTKAQVDLQYSRINLAKPGERRTKKRRPIVPIAPELRPTLEKAMNASDNDFVLGTSADCWRIFADALQRAGLKGHAHMLRHSRATHLLQDGVNPYVVANLLGDDLQTVLKVYGHHCPDYLAEAMTAKAGA